MDDYYRNFNGDGEVTVADLIMIAEAWGLEVGDDGWNGLFDLRVDGRIDIADVMMAAKLKVSPSTLTRLLSGQSSVTPETLAPARSAGVALRLSKTLGRSPESWLAMQSTYDLWQMRQRLDLDEVETLEFAM